MPQSLPGDLAAPPYSGLLKESLAGLEIARLLRDWRRLPDGPYGNGAPVMLLPGFSAGDLSMDIIRRYSRRLGYEARPWGLGRNTGNVPDLLPKTVAKVEEAYEETGRPLRLIGWSLGGFLAREAARERPEMIEKVITLGSPVFGGPKYTAVRGLYRAIGADLEEIEREVAARYEQPLETPVTAIYSKNDGVVAWQACIDPVSPNVEHIEVSASHLTMGASSDVLRIIASRLAAEEPSHRHQGVPLGGRLR